MGLDRIPMGLEVSQWVLGCPYGAVGSPWRALWGCEGCPCRVSLWVSMACPYGSWGVPMGLGVSVWVLGASLWVLGCPYEAVGSPESLYGAVRGVLVGSLKGVPVVLGVSLWILGCPYGSWGPPYGSLGDPMGLRVSIWVVGPSYES